MEFDSPHPVLCVGSATRPAARQNPHFTATLTLLAVFGIILTAMTLNSLKNIRSGFSARLSARTRAYLFNRYTLFFAAVVCYLIALDGGQGFRFLSVFTTELPVVLALYAYCAHILKPDRLQPWLAALPITGIYLVFDLFHKITGAQPQLAQLREMPALFHVLPARQGFVLAAVPLAAAGLFLRRIDWQRRRTSLAAGLFAALAAAALITLRPQWALKAYYAAGDVSQANTAAVNGRVTVLLAEEAKRRFNLRTLASYANDPSFRQYNAELTAFIGNHNTRRNVHLILMESLLDPTLFQNITLSRDPYSPEFRKLFGNRFGFIKSPVFSGSTAQVEFEMLCGLPASRQLGGIEFNRFQGPVPNLATLLGQNTYHTRMSHPSGLKLYNRPQAYSAMNFNEVLSAEKTGSGKQCLSLAAVSRREAFLFDRDYFTQLLTGNSSAAPLFDFAIGMYGHVPYALDEKERPKLITANSDAEEFECVINQFYYRTQAMAEYASAIIAREPRSLVIFTGDHLPGFVFDGNVYGKFGYLKNQPDANFITRLYILQNGKPVVYPTLRHYDLYGVVLDYVTDGAYCKKYHCGHLGKPAPEAELTNRYLRLMADTALSPAQ